MSTFPDWLRAAWLADRTAQQPEELTHDQLVQAADQFLDETLERLRKADEPVWEHQAQMGRTLITLAGGGIIASVSVIQLLAGKVTDPGWIWLLPASWVLWAGCILAGVSRESWMSTVRGTAAILERRRGELRLKIRELGPENTLDDYDQLIIDAFTEAEREPLKASRVHWALTQTVYWTFAGGIVGLVLFAIKNLPF